MEDLEEGVGDGRQSRSRVGHCYSRELVGEERMKGLLTGVRRDRLQLSDPQ